MENVSKHHKTTVLQVMVIFQNLYIKPVAEFVMSSMTVILNNFTELSQFPDVWKVAEFIPIPKIS